MATLWQPKLLKASLLESFIKLNPLTLWRNPVMFIVETGAAVTFLSGIRNAVSGGVFGFHIEISLWLWFTVLFANFAEAFAEIQGKARADNLRKTRTNLNASKLLADGTTITVSALDLKKGDRVVVRDNEMIPGDGDIIKGASLVDESAITGESAPVIRESGGDRCGVTGGTKVLSGVIHIQITAEPGNTFIDNIISMVESAKRSKTQNEIALEILLITLSALFAVVMATLPFYSRYMEVELSLTVLIAFLVCLMPTTIGGLLPAIGIAGMDRLLAQNVVALSGRAVEAAGDVNYVLLDKTGTITLGNRMAHEFIPAAGVDVKTLVEAAVLSSLSDETPEGRSIIVRAKKELNIKGKEIRAPQGAEFVAFTASSRMSGVNIGNRRIRKGACDAVRGFVKDQGGVMPDPVETAVESVAKNGDTPLVVAENENVLGVIRLKDMVKEGIRDRIAKLRSIGIRSIMITGDNPLTAASIAAEAGVDDFVSEAKPETKLSAIRKFQDEGYLVAMIGDGTNDAPALAQADVAVAMNMGTQAAREAANMIDLDSNPTKLLDIVETGKEILITRGALTTFSIANDVAKYFAIIPALFGARYPVLNALNLMGLENAESALLSAVIFNALIIPALIPLALRGVRYRVSSVSALLKRNVFIYGLGGLLLPFVCIKLIDMIFGIIR